MSNPFIGFFAPNACTDCPSNALTTVENDDISCNNNECPEGWVYLDTSYGCVGKPLPDGVLWTTVDDWLDSAKRHTIEVSYGSMQDWDVSLVKNFDKLFSGKTAFNTDISKWNVGAAETMSEMFQQASAFNGDLSKWQTGK